MAVEKNQELSADFIARVRELAHHVEEGNSTEADRLLDQIAKLRESSLFHELGKLTREFHDALNGFRLDARIASFAEKEFPDARERLRHVVKMTADSADRSLTAAENAMPICDAIASEAVELKGQWERFMKRDMGPDEFRKLSGRLQGFFSSLENDTNALKSNLNDVVMAQDFQDLTGQIITRVINLVDDMESNLVELIRISGQNLRAGEPEARQEDVLKGVGPAIPGVDVGSNIVSGQDEVDDLLSSLGF